MTPTPAIRRVAEKLLEELDAGWLHVIKVPGREGGYIRVVCNKNADWYSRFCQDFERRRYRSRYKKPRTIIKRMHTRKALLHLAAGKNSTIYSGRLIEFIERQLESS